MPVSLLESQVLLSEFRFQVRGELCDLPVERGSVFCEIVQSAVPSVGVNSLWVSVTRYRMAA